MKLNVALCIAVIATIQVVQIGAQNHLDEISLNLAWPNRFSAIVSDQRVEAIASSVTQNECNLEFSYKINGTKTDSGFEIKNDRSSISVQTNVAGTMNALLTDIVTTAIREFPLVRISLDGSISAPDVNKNALNSLDYLFKKYPDTQSKSLVSTVFAPHQITGSLHDQWNRLVQLWNGNTLKIGMWYQMNSADYSPYVGQRIQSETYFRILSRVNCPGEATGRRCVLIEGKSLPEALALTKAEPPFNDARFATFFTVITDPSTLLPYVYQELTEGTVKNNQMMSFSRVGYHYETIN